jgi:hypothetical protein
MNKVDELVERAKQLSREERIKLLRELLGGLTGHKEYGEWAWEELRKLEEMEKGDDY